ncbi:MAG: hypothetical protein KDD67_01360 [Ignavibacteriae bacterium]|nr:hypothetical protein [Ignavibacteriota bacterium]MCB9216533.1 hypothetical protein [Ignavibacteria bacterium]
MRTQKPSLHIWHITLPTCASLLLLLLMSCGEGVDNSKSGDQTAKQTESATWLLTSDHYDTLSPNPTPLSGGKPSVEELVEAGLKGLNEKDTATLLTMMISREEYDSIIYPELGKYWSGARDMRETITQWQRTNHFGSAEKGLRRLLRDYGGKSFKLAAVEFQDSTQTYPSYTIYQRPIVAAIDDHNKKGQIKNFGSIIEKNGVFKFFSFNDRN